MIAKCLTQAFPFLSDTFNYTDCFIIRFITKLRFKVVVKCHLVVLLEILRFEFEEFFPATQCDPSRTIELPSKSIDVPLFSVHCTRAHTRPRVRQLGNVTS